MKFQFKIQPYQTEAVEDTVNVFRGQPKIEPKHYRRDIEGTWRTMSDICTSTVKYNVVGDIAKGARLTRRTVAKILKGIGLKTLMFKNNPEEFIRNAIKLIKEQKATMIVDHITYNPTKAAPYDSTIFVPERRLNVNKALELSKHITPYVRLCTRTFALQRYFY